MIYPMVPFPVTLSDPYPRFQGHGVDAYRCPQRIVRSWRAICLW